MGTYQAPEACGMLMEPAAGGAPVLLLRALPTLLVNRAHQVWQIRDDGAISARVVPMGTGGLMVVQLQQAIDGAQPWPCRSSQPAAARVRLAPWC